MRSKSSGRENVNQSIDVVVGDSGNTSQGVPETCHSEFNGPHVEEASRREMRFQRRVTWLVMAAVVSAWLLGFGL